MKKCFVFVVCALSLAACKKNSVAEVAEGVACKNTTYYTNDSLIALTTEARSTSTRIIKIEDGIISTVAAQAGYEFWGPVISPNKERFICFRSTSSGNPLKVNDYENAELWMFNIDGSNGHVITTKSAQSWRAMGMADWAADGNHIVLAAQKVEPLDAYNPHWSIFVTDTTGALATKMNTRISHFTHPHFANGTSTVITYSALPVGIVNGDNFKCEIFYGYVNASYQLTSEHMVTNDLMFDYSPSFSADNSKICYCKTTSMAEETALTLHKYDITSGFTSTLVNDNTINDNPYWCATNNQIYYTNRAGLACYANCKRMDVNGGNNVDYFRTSNAHYHTFSVK